MSRSAGDPGGVVPPRRLQPGAPGESLEGGIAAGRVIGNSVVYTLGNLLPQAMNMLLLSMFTRYLSPAEFGIFSYTTGVCAFLALVGHLSIHSYVLRHYFDCRTEEARRRLFGTIFGFLITYNAVLLVAEFLLLPVVFRAIGAQVPFEPYMRLALLNNAIEILAILPMTYFRVREQATHFVALSLSQALLNGILSFTLVVVMGTGILGRYYGVLAANVVLMGAYLLVMTRVATFSWDRAAIRSAIVFSAPLSVAGLFWLVQTMSDRLILERFVTLSQLGVYGVGFSIAYGLNSLSNGIYKAIEPQVYRLAVGAHLDRKIVMMKGYIVLLLAVLGCIIIAFSREILAVLAGPSFQESYKIVALLVVAVVLQGATIPASTYVIAIQRTHYVPLVNMAGAGTSVAANLALVPILGIYGAAASSIMASLATLWAYKLLTERVSAVRWQFGGDLLWMGGAFGISAAILQIDTHALATSIALKALLVAAVIGPLVWRGARAGGLVIARSNPASAATGR